MSLQEGDWLYNKVANRHVQTYVKGFLDVSGGDVILRNGNLNVAGRSDLSGDTVMHQNANVRGLIKQSDTIIEGGFVYQEVVDPAIQDTIDELNAVKESIEGLLVPSVVNGVNSIYVGPNNETIIFNGDISGNSRFSVEGDASMNSSLTVDGPVNMNNTLLVDGDASMNSRISVEGDASMNSSLTVGGYVNMISGLTMDGDASMNSRLSVEGDASMNSSLTVDGPVNMKNTLLVDGDASMNSELSVGGNVNMNNTLSVAGDTNIDGAVSMNSTFSVVGDTSMNSGLSVGGIVGMNSSLIVDGDVSLHSDFSLGGNAVMNSTVSIIGDASMNSKLFVARDVSMNEDLSVGGDVNMNSDFLVNGAVSMNSTLLVHGDTSMNSSLSVGGNVNMNNALSIIGDVSINSGISVDGAVVMNNALTVDDAVTMNSTLLVDGDTSMNSGLSVGENVVMNSDVSIIGDTSMYSKLFVADDASMNSGLSVGGNVNINSDFEVNGGVSMNSTFFVNGDASMNSQLSVGGNVNMNNALKVVGDTSMNSGLTVDGAVDMNSALTVDGAVTMNSTLAVDGDISLNSEFSLSGNAIMNSAVSIIGDASMNSKLFVVGDTSMNAELSVGGDVNMNNTLTVDGAVSMNSTLFVDGDVSMNSDLSIGGNVIMNNALTVVGDVSINSELSVNGAVVMNNGLTVSEDVSLNNELFVGGDVSMNNDVFVGGDISVNGVINVMTVNSYDGAVIDGSLNCVDIVANRISAAYIDADNIIYESADLSVNSFRTNELAVGGVPYPETPFHVTGSRDISNANTSDLSNGIAKFNDISGVAGLVLGCIDNNSPYISDCNGTDTNSTGLRFLTQSQTRMMIDSIGNVGIGTNSPVDNLHIVGTNNLIRLTNTDSGGRATVAIETDDATWEIGARGSTENPPSSFYIYDTNYRMVINSSGNVGIGTTSPMSGLHVANGAASFTGNSSSYNSSTVHGIHLGNYTNGSDYYPHIQMVGNMTGGGWIDWVNSTTGSSDYHGRIRYDTGSSGFRFYTNSSERMRITNTGDVGIGSTSPTEKLDVNGNIHFQDYLKSRGKTIIKNTATNGDDIYADMRIIRNTIKSDGMYIGYGNAGSTSGHLRFYANGTTQRMIISASNGCVGIGTGSPSIPLHVHSGKQWSSGSVRYFRYNDGGLQWGDFNNIDVSIYGKYSVGTNTHIFAHSDRRIKKDIIEIKDDDSLKKIRLLKPSYYRYKDHIDKRESGIVEGFIAQEVEEVVPSAVKLKTGEIPNIMLRGTIVDDNAGNKIITIPNYNTNQLELDASGNIFTKLFIYIDEEDDSIEDVAKEVNIIEILSSTEIRVQTNEELPEEIFVYGQEVNNKRALIKDKIFTIGISALQEVDRQLQAEKEKTIALETKVSTLEAQLNSVLTRLSALENTN